MKPSIHLLLNQYTPLFARCLVLGILFRCPKEAIIFFLLRVTSRHYAKDIEIRRPVFVVGGAG